MHNKVVFRAARALNQAGLVTLRINFRGVGASTGTHDNARGEADDARYALDYLVENFPDSPVTLAGFSFGARIALEVGIRDARVQRLIAIGTPLKMYDFSFLKECRKTVLFVHGENDEFGDAEELKRLATTLPAEAQVVIIPEAGHFFDNQLDEFERVITEWMMKQQSEV